MEIELNDQQQRLVDTGFVLLVDRHSDEIPESERTMLARGFGGGFGSAGLACTILRDDGLVLIVVDGDVSAATLRHEFIHATQCYANEETMTAALVAAAEVGRILVHAIEAKIADAPETKSDHRDLKTTLDAWRSIVEGKGVMSDILTFQFYQDLYPTKETATLAREILGLDYDRGAYAALTAYACWAVGYNIDPLSDLAREIVAYTFECRQDEAIDSLMTVAVEELERRTKGPRFSRKPISFG